MTSRKPCLASVCATQMLEQINKEMAPEERRKLRPLLDAMGQMPFRY